MKDNTKTKKQLIDELTELRSQNAALKKSENSDKYRLLVENIRDIIYELDSQGVVLYISPAVRDILGYGLAEIEGKNFTDLAHKDDLGHLTEWFSELRKGIEQPSEYRVSNKSGELRWARTKARPIMEEGTFKGARGILIDVTEQRRVEKALKESEEKYRWVLDNMADVITVMDMNLRFTYVSPSILRMRGYTAEEAVAQTLEQVMTPESLQISAKVFEEEMKLEASGTEDPNRIRILEVEQYRKDGSIVLMENHLSFLRDEAKKAVGIISASHDITERKRVEESLRESEERYKALFDRSLDFVYITDFEGRFLDANQAALNRLGYNREMISSLNFATLLSEDQVPIAFQTMQEIIDTGYQKNMIELRLKAKNGNDLFVETIGSVILKDGIPYAVQGIARDITDRKRAEEALNKAKTLLDKTFASMDEAIFIVDSNTRRIIAFNHATEVIFGFEDKDLIGSSTDVLHVDKLSYDLFGQKLFPALDANGVFRTEFQMRRKDGSVFPTENTVTEILDDLGHRTGVISVVRDVTERNKMDKKLREHDIQLKKLTSWAPGMIYQCTRMLDGTLCVPFTTDAVKDIFGCSPEDIREDISPITRVILPEDLDKFVDSIEYSAQHLTIWTFEYRVQIPGQSIKWILGKSTPEKLADGSITWYGFNTDITETKKVEEALRKSEEEFRLLAESMPQIVWVTRKDGWNIYFNQQWVDYTGLTLEESYGHGWNIPFHPDDKQRAWSAWENATKNNGIYSLECRLRRADGVYHWWLVRGVPLLNETGEIIKWFGTCTDIDKIKHTEEQLQVTLESLRKSFGTIIRVMVSAVETRDPYTAGHQTRVAHIARAIATGMGLSQEKIDGIRMAGSIHDIGKLSIPAEILSKPTKLLNIEFSLIKEHSRKGYEMLKDVESPWPLAQIVYQHHERMDGSGYPRNLKGDEILLEARIMAVADVVESMASHRPYRHALGINAALEEIEKNKGILYDAEAVDVCLRLFNEKGYNFD